MPNKTTFVAPLKSGFRNSLEMRVDEDRVSIPIVRYEELVSAETELHVILRAYNKGVGGYEMEYVLAAVFGSLSQNKPSENVPEF